MNPLALQMLQMLKNGVNPQQLVMAYLSGQLANTPVGQNLLALAQKGDSAGVEQIARNLMTAKGLDYDKEFSAFKKLIGR